MFDLIYKEAAKYFLKFNQSLSFYILYHFYIIPSHSLQY